MINYAKYHSMLGTITIGAKNGSIFGLWIEGQKYHPTQIPMESIVENLTADNGNDGLAADPNFIVNVNVLRNAKSWLDRYFDGKKPSPDELPLNVGSSNFRGQVYKILTEIPYGKTTTYGDIAAQIAINTGKKMSARAVGGAVGRNPIAIIIPCHRVVGTKQALVGYAAGVDKKIALLTLEGVKIK